MKQTVDKTEENKALLEESLQNLGEITGTILELIHIGNILDSQDEEDKQTISLWGMHEKEKSSQDYRKSIDHVRKANSREKLKLSKIMNVNKDYTVVTIDKD